MGRPTRDEYDAFSGKTGYHPSASLSLVDKAPNGPNGWFRGLNRFNPDLS